MSHATDLTAINVGQNDRLILTDSVLPDARVGGAFNGGITLGAGVVIDRYGFQENDGWDDALDKPQGDPTLSTNIINHGTIENDIRFYIGDDLYDGRDGSVGGTVYGNGGNDRLLGGIGVDRFVGGYGADTLQGGAGVDVLTGGAGYDFFTDTKAGHHGDTITDFTRGDRLIFTDAELASFAFGVSGDVLTYSGGSIKLQGLTGGALSARQLAGGGVEIVFASPPIIISNTSVTLNDSTVAPKAAASAEVSDHSAIGDILGSEHGLPLYGPASWSFGAAVVGHDLFAVL